MGEGKDNLFARILIVAVCGAIIAVFIVPWLTVSLTSWIYSGAVPDKYTLIGISQLGENLLSVNSYFSSLFSLISRENLALLEFYTVALQFVDIAIICLQAILIILVLLNWRKAWPGFLSGAAVAAVSMAVLLLVERVNSTVKVDIMDVTYIPYIAIAAAIIQIIAFAVWAKGRKKKD